MKCMTRLIQKLCIAAGDRQDLNQQILRLHKCLKEVEKNLNRSKK